MSDIQNGSAEDKALAAQIKALPNPQFKRLRIFMEGGMSLPEAMASVKEAQK